MFSSDLIKPLLLCTFVVLTEFMLLPVSFLLGETPFLLDAIKLFLGLNSLSLETSKAQLCLFGCMIEVLGTLFGFPCLLLSVVGSPVKLLSLLLSLKSELFSLLIHGFDLIFKARIVVLVVVFIGPHGCDIFHKIFMNLGKFLDIFLLLVGCLVLLLSVVEIGRMLDFFGRHVLVVMSHALIVVLPLRLRVTIARVELKGARKVRL